MKRLAPVLVLTLALATAPTVQADGHRFDDLFTGGTLRFDYYHGGTATENHVSLDLIRAEGPWPGRRSELVDELNLGKYRFEVVDLRTHRVIYAYGFASIFGEWQTTGEAKRMRRTFHESQRFPEPRFPVQLVLKQRGAQGEFHEIWNGVIDPQSRFVDRSPVPAAGTIEAVIDSGPADHKVDLLFIGDGYATQDASKWKRDARKAIDALFAYEPFKSRRKDFNVRTLVVPSPQSGITDPRLDRWIKTPFGLSYNAFDSERYVLTYANRQLREYAAQVPYDAIVMIGNSRKYGGGGIYNLWCTSASDSAENGYLVVHEFGHSFAGLGDEYYTSSTSYENFNPPGVEPWDPNVTALLDPDNLKWKHLMQDEDLPLPTPWNQAEYDEFMIAYQKKRRAMRAARVPEEEMEKLFQEVREKSEPLLRANEHHGKVGAFQGAGYQAQGLYRPEADCIMFSRNPDHYCRVCTAAMNRVIDSYVK